MMNKTLMFLGVLALLVVFTGGKCSKSGDNVTSGTIALINGLIIDGAGGAPLANGTVVIDGDRITSVGSGADVAVPTGARTYDLGGAAVLPGFFNAHVHHGYSENNLRQWANAGVTTVRDIGVAYNGSTFAERDRLNADNRNARLISAGPMLTVPNGYPAAVFGSASAYPLTSLEDTRAKVTALLDDGADLLKIALERGSIWNRDIPILSAGQVAEILTLAHQRGKRVSAHVLVTVDLALAVEYDVDDVAHMVVDETPDELFTQMVEKDIYWVPTLELYECGGHNLHVPAIENLRKFVQAGGRVALGTDYDGYTCTFELGMPMKEIRLMLRAGMTPMQIINAATQNAAVVSGVGESLGTLEAGKIADLLVVNGNPAQDPETLTNVRMVVKNGEIIRQ